MYLRLPLKPVIDNARRLVLRHRVRPIKVSLSVPIEQKAKRARRSVRTDANRGAKSEKNASIALSLVAFAIGFLRLSFFTSMREAITVDTGRR